MKREPVYFRDTQQPGDMMWIERGGHDSVVFAMENDGEWVRYRVNLTKEEVNRLIFILYGMVREAKPKLDDPELHARPGLTCPFLG